MIIVSTHFKRQCISVSRPKSKRITYWHIVSSIDRQQSANHLARDLVRDRSSHAIGEHGIGTTDSACGLEIPWPDLALIVGAICERCKSRGSIQ